MSNRWATRYRAGRGGVIHDGDLQEKYSAALSADGGGPSTTKMLMDALARILAMKPSPSAGKFLPAAGACSVGHRDKVLKDLLARIRNRRSITTAWRSFIPRNPCPRMPLRQSIWSNR